MIDILKPKIFSNNIISGVTKKNISEEYPLGISFSKCDFLTEKEIERNRKFLANDLNYPLENLKFQSQVHGENIRIVNHKSKNEESDAMITKEKGILLNISIADCVAVLIFDPIKEIIAGVHSGWRGTEKNIAGKTINLMKEKFGSNTKDLLVYLSPAAQKDNYEVGWEVAEKFPGFCTPKDNGKFLLDNPRAVYSQIVEKDVLSKNIEKSEICTIANDNYHSYRRDKSKSGRMVAFIGLI